MELVYLLLEDCYRLGKHQEVAFTGKYNFSIVQYNRNERKLTLKIDRNENYFPNLFSKSILNITGIIGENGTGKTSFFEFLKRQLSGSSHLNEEFLAVFEEKNGLKIYHSLYDFDLAQNERSKSVWNVKVIHDNKAIQPKALGLTKIFDEEFFDLQAIPLLNKLVIYYSGIFDLKGYPYPENLGHIDVSTNVIIGKDVDQESYSMPDIDFLYIHKHKNALRQYKLIISGLLEKIDFKVPNTITISFDRVISSGFLASNDISPHDKNIFQYFEETIGKIEYPKANKIIYDARQNNDKTLLDEGIKHKCKLRFVDALISNFFLNIDTGNYFGNWSKVDIEELKKLEVLDAIVYFFNHQKIIDKQPALALINKIYKLIDDQFSITHYQSDNEFTTENNSGTVELVSDYENYLHSFTLRKPAYGFIALKWRDLSSGERALLDLYSRLYVAKEIANVQSSGEDQKEIETVYLMLDEAEIGFHPEWQRKYIVGINDFLQHLFQDGKVFKKTKVQVFIATHSPFVASDLPKTSLIFLKKADDSIFNVHKFEKEKTFGANIHTLLSDAFFLQNGLIGEFSKQKILDCLNFLKFNENKPESKTNIKPTGNWDQEKASAFIKIIGESLIAERLQRLYDDKYLTLSDIQNKIAELQEREKKLKQ